MSTNNKLILFINVGIQGSSTRKNNIIPIKRGNLKNDNKLDIFKYTLASLSVITWFRVFIQYEFIDNEFSDKYEETNEYIKTLFGSKAVIRNKRNQHQKQWIESVKELEPHKDYLIWFLCNDDHVFIDYNLNALNAMIDKMYELQLKNKDKYILGSFSHWPEAINFRYIFKVIDESNYYFVVEHKGKLPEDYCDSSHPIVVDSIQIITFELFRFFWTSQDYKDTWLPRSDPPFVKGKESRFVEVPDSTYYSVIPKRELCRHFDGYGHDLSFNKIDWNLFPPIEIPNGFFEKKIIIDYGFPIRRDSNTTWVNTNKKTYKATDIYGVDEKSLLNELPLFGKNTLVKSMSSKILSIRKRFIIIILIF